MVFGPLLSPGTPSASLVAALVLAALGLGLVYSVDGFAPGAFSSRGEFVRVLAAASAAGGALALVLAWRWPEAFSPLLALELTAGIAVSGAVTSRAVSRVSSRCARSAIARARALVIESREGGPLTSDVKRLGSRVDVVGRVRIPASTGQLKAALDLHGPDLVLVEGSLADIDFELLRLCSERAIRVLVLHRPSYGLAAGARVVRLGGLPWLSLRRLALAPRHMRAKRALDLGLLLLSAPVVLPVAGLVALAVACTSPGGVLYRQTRVGESGTRFVLQKFRTMRADAERDTGPVLAAASDARATAAGGFLRRHHLDELPQLWNVLRGDMTLVGPRPERPELTAAFSAIPGYDSRHLIRPGLTGLAQLVGGYSASASDKLRCDLLYLSSRSLWVDLRLVAATAADLVRGFPVR